MASRASAPPKSGFWGSCSRTRPIPAWFQRNQLTSRKRKASISELVRVKQERRCPWRARRPTSLCSRSCRVWWCRAWQVISLSIAAEWAGGALYCWISFMQPKQKALERAAETPLKKDLIVFFFFFSSPLTMEDSPPSGPGQETPSHNRIWHHMELQHCDVSLKNYMCVCVSVCVWVQVCVCEMVGEPTSVGKPKWACSQDLTFSSEGRHFVFLEKLLIFGPASHQDLLLDQNLPGLEGGGLRGARR